MARGLFITGFTIASATSLDGFSASSNTIDADAFTIATGAPGTWSVQKTGNDLELVYTSSGLPDPYATWAGPGGFNLTGPDAAKGADPDGEGQDNLTEFALDGDPTNGALNAKVFLRTGVVTGQYSGEEVLILTIAVRDGTVFTSGTAVNAADGIEYIVEGGPDLVDWGDAIFPLPRCLL